MPIETSRLYIHPFPTTDGEGDAIVSFWSKLYLNPRVSAGWDSAPSPASKFAPEKLVAWRDKLRRRCEQHGYGAHPVELKLAEARRLVVPPPAAAAAANDNDGGSSSHSHADDDDDDDDDVPTGPNGGPIIGVIELRTLTLAEFPTSLADKTVTEGDVELAYFFHPLAWGRGIATEAVAALVDWAMKNNNDDSSSGPRLKMVSGSCVDSNSASKKVMQAAGLKPVEGSLGFNPETEVYFRRIAPA
ncbi:hypothetical protein HDU87_004188 [Geranomyces variabilis]|uniref:N-acetyltransferase domain-containing protein n=1 Tax=Geranomyces variabilis TaxID=109894 RepID=A0AAD5TLF5_9FUNG|nr:hypothetical protein HDU87_004188 [Geranomyces variabilis]